jgi:LmbE family N-acetylglucosaminyl deacetylase
VTPRFDRLVVLSAHLDDAVLSLGAFIARSVRGGARVEVVTVFAGDPESSAPAGDWDRWSGFEWAGAASKTRREEDRQACARVGAAPIHLRFLDDSYDENADDATIRDAIDTAVAGADAVLVPGFPLVHPDHERIARLALSGDRACGHLGLYVELPYAFRAAREGAAPCIPEALDGLVPASTAFGLVPSGPRARVRKLRATACYESQVSRLGRLLGGGRSSPWRLLRAEGLRGAEAVAWIALGGK